jgi:hypothetical protein
MPWFFKRMHKFEEVDSITFFHKFTQQFVDKGFNNPWKFVINIILETPKTTLCNSRQVNLVATRFKKQNFITTSESLDDSQPQNDETCMIVKKHDKSTTKGKIIIPLFTINYGTIQVLK